MDFDNFPFPVIFNNTQTNNLLIKIFISDPPENNYYSFFNDRILEYFKCTVTHWLFVAVYDGFSLGSVEIPKISISMRINTENHVKIDEKNKIVYFEIDLSKSSIELLRILFTIINRKYYKFLPYRVKDSYFEGLPQDKNTKVLKVVIEDAKGGNV